MIYRHIAKIIDDATKHYPIVLLSGPRQIGKSTLLYGSFLNKGYSYVSFDDSLKLAMAKSDPATFLKLHKAPLIIDEVQKVPELFPELEIIVNEFRLKEGNAKANGLYILSGSQRQRLLEQSKESLSGRVAILDMTNLSLNEIFKRENIPFCVDISTITNRITDYTIDDLNVYKYIVRGFFPQLYEDMDMKHQLFYSSYLTTYLEKDLKINDQTTNEYKMLLNSYAKHMWVSTNTIKNWISALVKIGIIYLVEPYNEESIVKRVVKRPKMYFFDTGLACYLCGIDSEQTLKKSFLKGRFFETFIFNELRKSYINNGEVQNMFYYRDTHQNEVDFILIRNGNLSCIEIKTGQNFNVSDCKAFLQFANTKLNKGKNCIICTADKISMLNDCTLIIPISSI